jgi:hypothetical protein
MSNKNNIRNFTAESVVAKYRIIKFGTGDGTVAHAESATDKSFGVTTEVGAAAGERVDVIYSGPAIVESGGAFEKGDRLTSDSQGRAIKAAPSAGNNCIVIAQAFEAATTSALAIEINITPGIMQG